MNTLVMGGIAFAIAIGFGLIQTFNLRSCQDRAAQAAASYAAAIGAQNAKVAEWEQRAKAAQAKAAQAGKQAAIAAQLAKQQATSILAAPKPPEGATCEEREHATLELLRRVRGGGP